MKTYVIATAIIRDKDRFLIAKRAATKEFAPNQWEFISGFVDAPGSAEETILRELKEELGVLGRIMDTASPFELVDEEGRWVVLPFLVELEGEDIRVNPEDHEEIKWVAVDELDQYPDLLPFLKNAEIQGFLLKAKTTNYGK
ncbi:MAG: NUDIX domain-containing protein [Patescibacteria group bacterium]